MPRTNPVLCVWMFGGEIINKDIITHLYHLSGLDMFLGVHVTILHTLMVKMQGS